MGKLLQRETPCFVQRRMHLHFRGVEMGEGGGREGGLRSETFSFGPYPGLVSELLGTEPSSRAIPLRREYVFRGCSVK